jgi:hypothetical protein
MAQQAPEFETLDAFNEIATQLKDKYPHVFTGDISKVKCVSITNKDRPEKSKTHWSIIPVKPPISMDCPFSYYVVVYLKDWTELTETAQRLLVSDALMAIPAGDESKLNGFDLKDYATMIRTFGPDYLENDKAKDPINENVDWICKD